MPNTKRNLYIKTWGCQMNVYDSNRMADALYPLGFRKTENPENADMIILNTCHIREKATDKVFSELGRLREHKTAGESQGRKVLIAVAGCVAQAEGDFILERASYVDMVFGPQVYHRLPEMVSAAMQASGKPRIINTEFPTESKFDHLPEEHIETGASAFLSVQEGCDKFCTFCVVPYTRGAEFSRPAIDIINEAKKLSDQGVKEITLLGQNVNAWHGQGLDGKIWDLARLIDNLAKIDQIKRIRYTTSHPNDMDISLINAHRDNEKLMPFLHLPVQSGSDRILKAMNRKHEASKYYKIIEELRKAKPDIALSSDFIVGFPGEREEDFKQTVKLVEDITFASAYSFKYSPRPGTPASTMAMQVKEEVKSERLTKLQELLNAQQLEFNSNCVGSIMPVLFDRKSCDKENSFTGRTPYNQSIHIESGDDIYGKIIDVKITKGSPNSVKGEVST